MRAIITSLLASPSTSPYCTVRSKHSGHIVAQGTRLGSNLSSPRQRSHLKALSGTRRTLAQLGYHTSAPACSTRRPPTSIAAVADNPCHHCTSRPNLQVARQCRRWLPSTACHAQAALLLASLEQPELQLVRMTFDHHWLVTPSCHEPCPGPSKASLPPVQHRLPSSWYLPSPSVSRSYH